MDELERELDRIMREAEDQYPYPDNNFYGRQSQRAFRAEFMLRELKRSVMRRPQLLESFGIAPFVED